MRRNSHTLLLTSFLLLAWLDTRAQQASAPPPQSDSQVNGSSAAGQDSHDNQAVDPDNRPLSGAQNLSPGIPESSKNVLNASLGVQQRLDATTAASSYRWYSENNVMGTLLWNRTWRRNSLLLHYDGGTLLTGDTSFYSIQTFDISQLFSFGRWSLKLSDQASYAPESTYGLPGLEFLSGSFFGTNPTLLPNQTVFTGQTSRVSNGSIGELGYAISRRASLTATGSYSLLRYTASSLFDNTQAGGSLGYDYALTPRTRVALTYGYQQLGFNLLNGKLDINSATLGYAHQILGRFSLQLEAGAQLAKSFGPLSPSRNSVLPEGHFVMTSVWRRTQFSLTASKAVVPGAGLSVATHTTTAALSAQRSLSRTWTSTINVGYAANSLIGFDYNFKSGFAEANLEKAMGQHVRLSLLYNFQKQAGDTVCSFSLCAEQFLRHSVGVGVKWQFRPVGFR